MSNVLMSDQLFSRLQKGLDSPKVKIGKIEGHLVSVTTTKDLKTISFKTNNINESFRLLEKKFPISVIIMYGDASLNFDFIDPDIEIECNDGISKITLEEKIND